MIALLAHVGGGTHGLWDGLTHPLLGLDHVLAMVTVGVLAIILARPFAAPGVFLGGMALGGALGIAGVPAPGAEIAGSRSRSSLSPRCSSPALAYGPRRSSYSSAWPGSHTGMRTARKLRLRQTHWSTWWASSSHLLRYTCRVSPSEQAVHHRAPARATLGGMVMCAGDGLTAGII